MSREVYMIDVFHEVSLRIVILLVECSPEEVIICCRNWYFPVKVLFFRIVPLKYGTVGLILVQDTKHQIRCLCN